MTSRPRPRRARIVAVLPSLVGLALAPAACSNVDYGNPIGPGFASRQFAKELGVESARYRHTILFPTDSAEIDAVERGRLGQFLSAVGVEAGDEVRIEGYADERAGDLYNLELSSQRIESVAAAVRAAGFGAIDVLPAAYGKRAPAVEGSNPEAWRRNRRVEVVVDRTVAILPDCPDWSRESGTDFANLPMSNLGCGVRTNQGLMVADPGDLARGRALAPADGVKAADAIDRYRRGEVTELEEGMFE